MPRTSTVKVDFQDGAQLLFTNAQAEEGNGKLIIFRLPAQDSKDATATILASLDSDKITSWKIEASEAS